jgi:hypothetical protein
MKLDFLYLNRFVLFGIFSCLLLSACQPDDRLPIQATLLPTKTVATQSPVPILMPTNTLQYQTLDEVLSDEKYLQDCKTKYPPVYNQQIGFLEIYPGITKVNDLTSRLGNSYQFEKTDEESGYYYDIGALFVAKDETVESIYIDQMEMLLPLRTLLEKYGCPDVINAEALTDDAFETSVEFNKTILGYVHAGMWIRFENYPVSYSDFPSRIGFETPLFMRTMLSLGKRSKPVSFSEAVIDK